MTAHNFHIDRCKHDMLSLVQLWESRFDGGSVDIFQGQLDRINILLFSSGNHGLRHPTSNRSVSPTMLRYEKAPLCGKRVS